MAQKPAEAAVRWRISAAIIDNVLVYFAYLLLCAALHWRVASLEHLLVLVLLGVAYHFALESRDGQTIGKRQYGIRVVSLDGGELTPKAVAMRSVLRIVDQLPLYYLSGLVNMVRTGPARRQRIGDVAAATTVIAVDGHSARRGTPGWMLPAATIFAALVSAVSVYAIAQAGNQPLSSAQNAQFVAGCQRTGGSAVDCECFLSRLEADGYTTTNSLESVITQAASEEDTGQFGTARQDLTAAALGCRR